MAEHLPEPPGSMATVLAWTRSFKDAVQGAVDRLDREKFAYPLGSKLFTGRTTSTVTAAGTAQGDAAALAMEWSQVTVTGTGQGVKLASGIPGREQVVFSIGTADFTVYPQTGQRIGTFGTNAGVPIGPGTTGVFRAMTPGRFSVMRGT